VNIETLVEGIIETNNIEKEKEEMVNLENEDSVKEDFVLTLETTDREEDIDFIENSLKRQNRLEAPSTQSKEPVKYNLVIKDSGGDVVGGVITTIYRYSMYVETLWIDEKYRKYGYGKKLMIQAEETARAHGCTMMQLDTFNYQAPEFYKKLGFIQYGALEYKEGFIRHYMVKQL